LSTELKAAHQSVLLSLVNNGRPPTIDELEVFLGDSYGDSLQTLAPDDLVVLNGEGTQPVGAYPVTSEITPHKITVNGKVIYAMCALDAVSVGPMFDVSVTIESRCHVSQTPITICMQGSELLETQPASDIIIGVRWQMPSAVAAHSMCLEMVFFSDRQSSQSWKDADNNNISLFTLTEAVEFGKAFFLPLLK